MAADFATQLSQPARARLTECVGQYAGSLLDEASRMEAGQRDGSGDPEITSTIVSDADTYLRRAYRRQGPSRWGRLAQFVGTAAGIAVGVFATDLTKGTFQIGLVVSVALVMLAGGYSIWGEKS